MARTATGFLMSRKSAKASSLSCNLLSERESKTIDCFPSEGSLRTLNFAAEW